MKRRLISLLEHMRADLSEAITAIEAGDISVAVGKLDEAAKRLRTTLKGMRS